MSKSFKRALKLFCAKQKVTLFLLLSVVPASAAPTRTPYGPHVIRTAGLWTIEYIEVAQLHKDFYQEEDREAQLIHAFKQICLEVNSQRIQFRQGGDPIFVLNPGEAPRMAVTGDDVASPIIFNMGLIANPARFSYGDAVALWVHELGHKVRARFSDMNFSQAEVDAFGAKLKRWYGDLAKIYPLHDLRILTLFPVPRTTEGGLTYSAVHFFPPKIRTTFAIIDGDDLIDFSEDLERALDSQIYPNANYIESTRMIEDIQPIKADNDQVRLHLEIRTSRLPRDMSFYVLDQDMGTNLYRSLQIDLKRDLSGLAYGPYRREKQPRPMIFDAEAELSDVAYDSTRREIVGRLKMRMLNQKYFHVASYPRFSADFLVLVDGVPERLTADVEHWAKWTPMPHQAYQRTQEIDARFKVELGDINGREMEFLSLVSRFFEYGGSAQYGENELYRVRFKNVTSLALDGCENHLATRSR